MKLPSQLTINQTEYCITGRSTISSDIIKDMCRDCDSCHFPSLTLLRFLYSPSLSPIISLSPFLFFLADPSSPFINLGPPLSSQSLSPTGLPGSLFLVPSSSSFFSPPAPHTGLFGPGCHQWRNQRKLLHGVSGWLSGHYASHLCEW